MKNFYNPSIGLICFFLLWANGCSNSAVQKASHYKKGMEYVSSGNVKAAILEFRNAIKIDPKYADARYQLGLAYMKARQPANAFKELERAASLDPENTDALIKTAEIYFLGNHSNESREKIRKIFEKDKNFPDAYALLAQIELKEANVQAAEKAISRALELKTDESRYFVISAFVMSAANRLDQAERALRKAVKLDPRPDHYKALAQFFLSRKRNVEAEQIFRDLIAKYPDKPQSYLDLAMFYMSQGKPVEAEKSILDAIHRNPEAPGSYIFLGNFYRRARAFEKAEQAYKNAIGKSKSPSNIRTLLADLNCETGKYDLAAREVESVLAADPGNPPAKLVRAKLLIHDLKYDQAQSILDRLIKDSPRWGEAYFLKGVAHFGKGETEFSMKAVDRAIGLNPRDANARTLRAENLLLKRDFKVARDEAVKALQSAPYNLRAAIILGKAELSLGENDRAVKIFEELERHAPENVEILYNESAAYQAEGNVQKTRDTLEKILAIDPAFTPALVNLTRLLVRDQKADEAVARVNQAIQKSPDKAENLILLAGLMDDYGNSPEQALQLLEKVRKISPELPIGYTMTAGILVRQGKAGEAIRKYKTLLELKPAFAEGHMAMGTLLEQTGDYAGASAAYTKALELRPNFAAAANNLAWIIANSPDPDLGEALRLALIAKEDYPEDPNIADTLGWIHYKRGSQKLALTQFTMATEKNPDMGTFRYHLALALLADGQTGVAKKELIRCLAANEKTPDHAEAEKLLKEISTP